MINVPLFVSDTEQMNRLAPILARREYGPGTYISRVEEHRGKDLFIYRIGLKIPIEIADAKDYYQIIRKLPDIEEIRFEMIDSGKFTYKMRSFEEFTEALKRRDFQTNQMLERELVKNTYEAIARIPNVANTMTPFMEISNSFRFRDRLELKELERSRKNKEQISNYIGFMVRSGYLVKEGNFIYPTSKLKDNLEGDPSHFSVKLIGDMLKTGYVDLMRLLHLSGLKPYFSAAYSYYMPSSEARKLLKMGIDNLSFYHRKIYRSGVNRIKLQNHVSMLSEVDILSVKDRMIMGKESLLEKQLSTLDSFTSCYV